MFIRSVTTVLIEQGLLNDLANTDYVELVVAPHLAFSIRSESITSIELN